MLADNDKRNRKAGIELAAFFIAQLRQQVAANDDHVLYTFPYMLKDPVVLGSAERLLWLMDRLEHSGDAVPALRLAVLDDLWRHTYTNALPADVQHDFCRRFADHLLDTIALRPPPETASTVDFDSNYTHLVGYCRQHGGTFQAIVSAVARRMLASQRRRADSQEPLASFLHAVRHDMRPSAFRRLYAERMVPLVSLLSAAPSTMQPAELEPLLLPLRHSDAEQFVVLVTHFPRWLYLLDRLPVDAKR